MTAAEDRGDRTRLTELLRGDIDGFCAAVLRHPFITGLTDGSLPRDAFRHYLTQDGHYLHGYSRVLALCAAKAEHPADLVMFSQHAGNTVASETALHAALWAELGADAGADREPDPVGPTTQAYLSYLLSVAYGGSYAEVVGAVLPCYRMYATIGARLRAVGSPDPLYTRWIDAYGDTGFQRVTDEVLAATDRLGARVPRRQWGVVRERVRTAARYEWMFWDAGYRRETWPV